MPIINRLCLYNLMQNIHVGTPCSTQRFDLEIRPLFPKQLPVGKKNIDNVAILKTFYSP